MSTETLDWAKRTLKKQVAEYDPETLRFINAGLFHEGKTYTGPEQVLKEKLSGMYERFLSTEFNRNQHLDRSAGHDVI